MRSKTRNAALAAICAGVLALSACGGDDDSSDSSSGDTTITWWHNSNNDPGRSYYEKVAKDFEADHPGVKVEISAMAHEDMVDKLSAAFQSGDVPDVYMERGGGELRDHVDAGLVRDISDDVSEEVEKIGEAMPSWQVDGQTYALPFSFGIVGFWYNTDLFKQAGITEEPATLSEWEDAVQKLKDAGIEPVSVGAGDGWPAGHYWYYSALRQCSQDVLEKGLADKDFSDPCFVKAGETVQQILDAKPFNQGYLATKAQEGATSASGLLATGKVAMEMQGHWEPGVMQGLTDDGKGLGDKTGWFPFPAVEGGAGDPAAALGGGDAWAVAQDAPDEAVEFVKYLLSDEVQVGFAENSIGLPTNPAAVDSVADPALAGLIDVRDQAPYIQVYFDTTLGESVGGAMNEAIGLLFAGKGSPQDVVDATQQAADQEG